MQVKVYEKWYTCSHGIYWYLQGEENSIEQMKQMKQMKQTHISKILYWSENGCWWQS